MQKQKNNTFDFQDAENICKVLASQFSFRNSAQFSKQFSSQLAKSFTPTRRGYIRPQSAYFKLHTIRSSGRAPAKQVSELALRLFQRMLARQVTQRALFNGRIWREEISKLDSLDSRDLMIRCRRVAKRVLARRRRRIIVSA